MPSFSILSGEQTNIPSAKVLTDRYINMAKDYNKRKDSVIVGSNWTKTWTLLKQLADILTHASDNNNNNVESKDQTVRKHDLNNGSNEGKTKNNEDISLLFPKKNNVQNLGFTSIIPCSMNIDLMENPIQLEILPNGIISSTLKTKNNTENITTTGQNTIRNTETNINSNTNVDTNSNIDTIKHDTSIPLSPKGSNSSKDVSSSVGTSTSPKSAADTNSNITSPLNGCHQDLQQAIDDTGLFICHYCDAKFKIRGYLTRHIKKHAIEKAYHCPFYNDKLPPELRCHNSGGFSRRDTYKTHLKARHFTYPEGVKPNNRSKSSGHCTQCNEFFSNSDIWIKEHIENGKCNGLPQDYIHNVQAYDKKKKKSNNKLKMIKTSTGHSRFVSTAESLVEPKVLLNKEALEAMAIVANNTNNSRILSKYGDNQLIMNSDNFQGHKKPKRKYKPRNKNKNKIQSALSTEDFNASSPDANSPNGNNLYNIKQDLSLQGSPRSDLSPLSLEYQARSAPPITMTKTSSSNSSSSSFNCNSIMKTTSNNNNSKHDMNLSNINSHSSTNSVTPSSIFLAPLDIEQQSSSMEPYKGITLSNTNDNNGNSDVSLEASKVNDIQLRETKQYLNFYNFLFGSNL